MYSVINVKRALSITLLFLSLCFLAYAQSTPKNEGGITKEVLQQRLVELQSGRDQAMANLNAYSGAIQECQHWIDYIEAASKQEQPKK